MQKVALKLGALALGAGLAFSVAMPASAEHLGFDDPAGFADDFVGCAAEFGVSDCTEEILEDTGLEDQEETVTVVDNTPFNPIDEGSIETIVEDDVVFPSEVVEE
jgi:hypothetical protein